MLKKVLEVKVVCSMGQDIKPHAIERRVLATQAHRLLISASYKISLDRNTSLRTKTVEVVHLKKVV